MSEKSEYRKRVEWAARTYLARPGNTIAKTAAQYTVLRSDLRKRVLEITREQDDREE